MTLSVASQAIIDRLAAINKRDPIIDRDRVEAALNRHFDQVGLRPVPMAWVRDLPSGYRLAAKCPMNVLWLDALQATESTSWTLAGKRSWSQAEKAAWCAAGDEADVAVVHHVSQQEPGTRPLTGVTYPPQSATTMAALFAAEAATRSPALLAADALRAMPELGLCRLWMWAPFLEAAEAGLWVFWVTPLAVIAVPRPCLWVDTEGRLHREDGPAVVWPGGAEYHFRHGESVEVPGP